LRWRATRLAAIACTSASSPSTSRTARRKSTTVHARSCGFSVSVRRTRAGRRGGGSVSRFPRRSALRVAAGRRARRGGRGAVHRERVRDARPRVAFDRPRRGWKFEKGEGKPPALDGNGAGRRATYLELHVRHLELVQLRLAGGTLRIALSSAQGEQVEHPERGRRGRGGLHRRGREHLPHRDWRRRGRVHGHGRGRGH
jgi:hypothetical protein